MEIKSLENTSLAILTECLNASFADYIITFQVTEEQLKTRWRAARVRYDLSFGAFEAGQLVGFFITGVDQWEGKVTAFNMATGVIPAFRGQRLVKQLYEHAFPQFRADGIEQCMLEVIIGNDKAIRAYQSVGFEIGRSLYCFSGPLEKVEESINPPLRFRKTAIPRWKKYTELEPYAPTWEHTAAAIDLQRAAYEYWEFYEDDDLMGYFVIRPDSGFTPQIGVRPGRWNDMGPFLFARIAKRYGKIKLNNVESTAEVFLGLLRRRNLKNAVNQYEMKLLLQQS